MTFAFFEGPWENSDAPTIVRYGPDGGDPHIIATLSRVHDTKTLHALCAAANRTPLTKDEIEELREILGDALAQTAQPAWREAVSLTPSEYISRIRAEARLQALEEAAALCEAQAGIYQRPLDEGLVDHGLHCKAAAARALATAIRELKEGNGNVS